METQTSSYLPKLVAEIIQRMTPQEKQIFFGYLSFEEIKELYDESTAEKHPVTTEEPLLYISDREDGMSLELPEKTAVEFIYKLSNLLSAKKIALRYRINGDKIENQCNQDEFSELLAKIQPILLDKSVVIEFDNHTLYSNGGGCMLLDADISFELKKKIANYLLEINGYSEQELKNNFTVIIKSNQKKGGGFEENE